MNVTPVGERFPSPRFLFVNHFPICQSRAPALANEAETQGAHLVILDPERSLSSICYWM